MLGKVTFFRLLESMLGVISYLLEIYENWDWDPYEFQTTYSRQKPHSEAYFHSNSPRPNHDTSSAHSALRTIQDGGSGKLEEAVR